MHIFQIKLLKELYDVKLEAEVSFIVRYNTNLKQDTVHIIFTAKIEKNEYGMLYYDIFLLLVGLQVFQNFFPGDLFYCSKIFTIFAALPHFLGVAQKLFQY